MREVIRGMVTPQMKNISVNDRFGNSGIKKQQGSTVIKYDTLPLDGSTQLRFFEQSSQRNFPLSNTGTDGNKLGVGNSMVVERIYLTLVQYDATGNELTSIAGCDLTTTRGILINNGEFGFEIANSLVIKNVPVLSFTPQFNKNSENQLNNSFDFDTQIIIPPLLEFVATLRLPNYTAFEGYYLRLTIEGSGAIIAPKTTF
jgi:hypothetical protein